jgi:hypothetical protein
MGIGSNKRTVSFGKIEEKAVMFWEDDDETLFLNPFIFLVDILVNMEFLSSVSEEGGEKSLKVRVKDFVKICKAGLPALSFAPLLFTVVATELDAVIALLVVPLLLLPFLDSVVGLLVLSKLTLALFVIGEVIKESTGDFGPLISWGFGDEGPLCGVRICWGRILVPGMTDAPGVPGTDARPDPEDPADGA